MRTEMKTGVLTALIVFVVLTSGCLGGGIEITGGEIDVDPEEVETNETGDEILMSSLSATEDVEKYTVEADSRLRVTSFFFSMSIPVSSNGSFNHKDGLANLKSEGVGEIEIASSLSNKTRYETTTYATRNTTYVQTRDNGRNADRNTDWSVRERGASSLPLSLDDTASVYEDATAQLEGAETVHGDEAYVLSLNLSPEDAGEHIERVTNMYGPDELGDDDREGEVDEISDEAVDEFETYLWVDQETRRPLKFSYYLLMDFEGKQDSELSGVGEFKSEIEFSNYDKPVDIQLPEELDG